MDEIYAKVAQVRTELMRMLISAEYFDDEKVKNEFAEEYLGELYEFLQNFNFSQIESKYTIEIVNDVDNFYGYLQNFKHSIVFDGSYIHAALLRDDMFIVHFRTVSS